MNISNKIMLITYPDSIGGNLRTLNRVLNDYFKDAVGGIHILPFSLPAETGDFPQLPMNVWNLLLETGTTLKCCRKIII